MHVLNEPWQEVILQIHVDGDLWLYEPKQVTLLTGERFIDILKTHFEIYEPSDKNDELVQAVMGGDAKHVYAIIRQAYADFRESTSASFGVDGSSNFFVVDANGDRRTFIPDEITKDGITNAIECKAVDTPQDLARGDLVRILPSSWYYCSRDMKPTLGKVGTIVKVFGLKLHIHVCGKRYLFRKEDVALVNRGPLLQVLSRLYDDISDVVLTTTLSLIVAFCNYAESDTLTFA
ncbi:hypothetical protein DPMN_078728 [Dreissena polymorpha]|uniref:Uncharacterized protein n=1 Tax=Dreissena polymorpha TaxID=45954 RepID=A0A9D3YPD6_DREPO|nr:hypothetical protein DPMN_078728 [Dreissena polymorpha]